MHLPFRPHLQVLDEGLTHSIIDEAFDVLSSVGIAVEHDGARALLLEGGARGTGTRLLLPRLMVEEALHSVPSSLTMFDRTGNEGQVVGGDTVSFDPGSAALRIFDYPQRIEREATTADLINFCRVVQHLEHIRFQSTGLASNDVPHRVADCYRLYLALLHNTKAIITGTFVVEGFRPMAEMLAAVRGGGSSLKEKPLAIFDACPSPPLRWSHLTTQSLLDCARAGIPAELVAMPMTGATAPVTLTGALVQHTAENLSGIVIAQLAQVGAPVIFGGSPAAFDMRVGTLPMGAMETMMIDIAYARIGKTLGLPTHAYIGLSDAKCVDAQAGLETGIGAVLAALAGINVVSGAGMMDYENCLSLEKLVIDNEICGMALRLIKGIVQREDRMALPLLAELAETGDFLTHPHTMRWLREEMYFPKIIDRGNAEQWIQDGKPTLEDRAAIRVHELLAKGSPPLEPSLANELHRIMAAHAHSHGMERLPEQAPES
jgi:trimethylamine---corrinoid protein Co-methyltransferase